MKIALIICTYLRPLPLLKLLQSVQSQTVFPDEIIIVDGAANEETKTILSKNKFEKLKYFKIPDEDRGLTKQRNFGIKKVDNTTEIICFLDDDIVLESDYFEQLIKTYQHFPDALGVGGYINNEIKWDFVGDNYKPEINEFYYDGWTCKEGSRFILRKILGIDSNCPPGYSSLYSHGRNVGFLPPSDKTYKVEMLMGGVSSFRKKLFDQIHFSTYFEGYGLYEDADFCLRASRLGQLYLNTAARLNHYHDASGRPNQYLYGKMVVRNGWYVWRVKNPNPNVEARFKWHAITIVLTIIRFTNAVTGSQKKAAFTEALGRTVGWWSLLISKPKIEN
ncbi:glycosyltransferase family 2 protein [Flavobacterium algicola]|uniref:glycosyltransferase family 2 protein n=1 Tax=Flavobacterium algicola TaxID=556529 RepID=UPI001EFDC59B|nr:glycosyltransferase [Flavobacterium algicola]MCG9793880.1 glycosyltransferase [Flavobacterium algicola]